MRVVVNGDGVDFLMNEDPLELDRGRAAEQARAIVASRESAGVLAAFGRVLARGGEVVIRLGNHDIELILPEVQEVLRGALGQPPEIARRLQFQPGTRPGYIVEDVHGARILVTHGEHNDHWNRVDYKMLATPERYEYAPGTKLVKQLMNPIAREHNLRFVSLLKPDFEGAALTALAVEPRILKEAMKEAGFDIGKQFFARKSQGPVDFGEGEDTLELAQGLAELDLSDEEKKAFMAHLDSKGPDSFGEDDGIFARVKTKIARVALKVYASVQRARAGSVGDDYFSHVPDDEEWSEAQRYAEAHQADAVVFGHTHAARWRATAGLVYVNTGTWIYLMKLPSSTDSDDDWADFLEELRSNPALDPERQDKAKKFTRFTAAVVEPHADGGAWLSLVQWENGQLTELENKTRVLAKHG